MVLYSIKSYHRLHLFSRCFLLCDYIRYFPVAHSEGIVEGRLGGRSMSSWPHSIHCQEAGRDECWCFTHFLFFIQPLFTAHAVVLPTFGMGFPTSEFNLEFHRCVHHLEILVPVTWTALTTTVTLICVCVCA